MKSSTIKIDKSKQNIVVYKNIDEKSKVRVIEFVIGNGTVVWEDERYSGLPELQPAIKTAKIIAQHGKVKLPADIKAVIKRYVETGDEKLNIAVSAEIADRYGRETVAAEKAEQCVADEIVRLSRHKKFEKTNKSSQKSD